MGCFSTCVCTEEVHSPRPEGCCVSGSVEVRPLVLSVHASCLVPCLPALFAANRTGHLLLLVYRGAAFIMCIVAFLPCSYFALQHSSQGKILLILSLGTSQRRTDVSFGGCGESLFNACT